MLIISSHMSQIDISTNMYFLFIFFVMGLYGFQINDIPKTYYLTSPLKIINFPSKNNTEYFLPVLLENMYNVRLIENVEDKKLSNEMKIFLYQNGYENKSTLEDLKVNFVQGNVVGHENDSSVDGFVDDYFYGRIILNNSVFYISNKLHYFVNNKSEPYTIIFKYNKFPSNFKQDIKTMTNILNSRNICTLIILIDNSFYRFVARENSNYAIAIVLSAIRRTNSIYRSVDFDNDGKPDNIGFKVKYILIMESVKDQEPYILPYRKLPYNSKHFMAEVSKFPNFKQACLGVVFTAQTFLDNVIGLSYTATALDANNKFYINFGGICASTFQESFNVILITYFRSDNIRLPEYYTDLSLSHEIGHSFGSQHDDNTCGKGFLMDSKAPTTISDSSFLFSPCSKFQINSVIKTRRVCFGTDYSEFCGNGIVETNEECDCGSYYNCVSSDDCCLPNNLKDGCKINRIKGYTCHPSQGLCCLSNCKIRDLSEFGLSCKNFEQTCGNNIVTSCGIEGSCLKNYCHSSECTRIGLPECYCPPNKEGTRKICRTCCNYKGKCVTALIATQMQIASDINWLLNLSKTLPQKIVSSRTIQFVKLCYGRICMKISFRVFRPNTFCLLYGKLGYCNSEADCVIPNEKYMKLPKYFTGSSIRISAIFNKFYIVILTFFLIKLSSIWEE